MVFRKFQSLILVVTLLSCQEDIFKSLTFPFVRIIDVEMDADGVVTMRGEVLNTGDNGIIDHGFIWSSNADPTIQTATNLLSLGNISSTGSFSATVNAGFLISNRYHIRAFATSSTQNIHSEVIVFQPSRNSPSPVISDFNPKQATWNDQITITGSNFSSFDNTSNTQTVSFGSAQGNILNINENEITVSVPIILLEAESKIVVNVGGIISETTENFVLSPPVIATMVPTSVQVGTEVTLTGSNFYPDDQAVNIITLGGTEALVSSTTNEQIKFFTPGLTGGDYTVSLEILGQQVDAPSQLQVTGPSGNDFMPTMGIPGTQLQITGSNFSTDPAQLQVLVGSFPANIGSNTASTIIATVPFIASGDYSITVISTGVTINFPGVFTVEPTPITTSGLVAYYPFNGNANDESGSGFNGVAIDNPSLIVDRDGNANAAFNFDGIDDGFRTSNQIDELLAAGFTFSAWLSLPQTTGGIRSIVSNFSGQGLGGDCNGKMGIQFRLNTDGRLRILYLVDSDNIWGITTDSAVQSGQWVHVAMTWDGSLSGNVLSTFDIYIDGVLQNASSSNVGSIGCSGVLLESPEPFKIGQHLCQAGPCHLFEGGIDDLRIYSRVLDNMEITTLSQE